MNPISRTAFYCCGVRMEDAQQPHPVCGDTFAERFMDQRGREIFALFSGEVRPNASNVARHRYIDDWLKQELRREPRLQIVSIGCGFDSRAFRLTGGRWYELDEPQLLDYKNERLPARDAPNPLQRIPIDFANDSLREKLQPLSQKAATVFVIEGVTMYLPPQSLRATLEILTACVPRHRVIADLMTARFLAIHGERIQEIIAQLGARMIPTDRPALPFEQVGYAQLSCVSIIAQAFRYRSRGWLVPILRLLMPTGFSGYTVRVFTSPGAAA